MAKKSIAERALEMAVKRVFPCPIVPKDAPSTENFCAKCPRDKGLEGCYKMLKAHFLKLAKAQAKKETK